MGFTTSLRFSIAQHSRDLLLLKSLVKFFGGGYVMSYKTRPAPKGECEYIITKIDLVMEKVIPFFDKYSIVGVKSQDYEDFKKVVLMVKDKKHLTLEGLNLIKNIKEGMNKLRKD